MIETQLTRFEPWFSNCTIPNIQKTRKAYYISLSDEVNYKYYLRREYEALSRDGLTPYKSVTHNGYLPHYTLARLPYCGRFGSGYIIARHHNNNKVMFDYYLR